MYVPKLFEKENKDGATCFLTVYIFKEIIYLFNLLFNINYTLSLNIFLLKKFFYLFFILHLYKIYTFCFSIT